VLSTVDMVVQRRDGPRRLRELDDKFFDDDDDDDDESNTGCHCSTTALAAWEGYAIGRVRPSVNVWTVNALRARLVPGWVTVFGRVYHLGM